jgi:hypothetical protein
MNKRKRKKEVRVNGEDKGGRIWFMYLIYLFENRIVKPVEIVLRRGGEG